MSTPAQSVTIKNFKPARSLSEETLAFTASVYVDGVKAGQASNHGTGGSNLYHFSDPALRDRFFAYAQQWGAENNVSYEPADALISRLCEDVELAREARRLLKPWGQDATGVVLVEKGAQRLGTETFYNDAFLVVVQAGEDAAAVAAAQGAERWRLIAA